MSKPSFVYVTYIETTAEKLWRALTDSDVIRRYWAGLTPPARAYENVSDWEPGSRWEQRRIDDAKTVGLVGEVLESTPPRRLVLTWARPENEKNADLHSRVTFEIDVLGDRLVKLTVLHEELDPEMQRGIVVGWPQVLSNLKTLLETGHSLATPELEQSRH